MLAQTCRDSPLSYGENSNVVCLGYVALQKTYGQSGAISVRGQQNRLTVDTRLQGPIVLSKGKERARTGTE